MIRSVTIKDSTGKLIIRVSCKKSGIELTRQAGLDDLDIDVRDESGKKVWFDIKNSERILLK
jgi:hypothetical protein